MKARGKRERSGARRPWCYIIKFRVALKGRNTGDISAFQALTSRALSQPRGDALRTCSRLSHGAPSALSFAFWCNAIHLFHSPNNLSIFFKHRARVGPMLPSGVPNSAAISAYGGVSTE